MSAVNEDFWAYAPRWENPYCKAELIEQSIDRWLVGDIRMLDILWFWLWLWLGVERSGESDPFWGSDRCCAFSEPESNIGASMNSGPWNACDWKEWVVAFPHVGYAVIDAENY